MIGQQDHPLLSLCKLCACTFCMPVASRHLETNKLFDASCSPLVYKTLHIARLDTKKIVYAWSKPCSEDGAATQFISFKLDQHPLGANGITESCFFQIRSAPTKCNQRLDGQMVGAEVIPVASLLRP